MRSAGDQRVGAAAAGIGDSAGRPAGGHEDGLRIAVLDRDRADAAPEEFGGAQRATPALAAVLGLVDAHSHLATAAASVGLSGAGPDGLVVGIVGIERQRGGALVLEGR